MHRGWLTNPKRRERRDKAHTFTDKDAQRLITTIEEMPEYLSPTLDPELYRLLRLRDKALIAVAWIWFKRGGEVLSVKRKDVGVTDREVLVRARYKKDVCTKGGLCGCLQD